MTGFVATFGFVKVTTPRTNVTGAHITEDYRWWTACGVRMSMADDGLTFGTNSGAAFASTSPRRCGRLSGGVVIRHSP